MRFGQRTSNLPLLIIALSTALWSIGLARYTDHRTDSFPVAPPNLELPWGTYEGRPYSKNVVVYKNVRFGKAPVGKLRFQRPEFPDEMNDYAETQNFTSPGPMCMQAGIVDPQTGLLPPHRDEETEDCLFLDIYVPYAAFDPDRSPLPVALYFYGGEFISGSKDTTLQLGSQPFNLNDGKGLIDAAQDGLIWVVGNYRLGAWGWLAGMTMENDNNTTPNAGLYDQRLMMEFIQRYIRQVRGDPEEVVLMGHAAGAASIVYHCTAGNAADQAPKFARAVLWSPTTQWLFSRKVNLENTFKLFVKKAGCSDPTVACLQSADTAALKKADQEIVLESFNMGLQAWGPALDGNFVRVLPPEILEITNWRKPMKSVLVSHVYDEGTLHMPNLTWVDSEDNWQRYLNMTWPGVHLEKVRTDLTNMYKLPGGIDTPHNQLLRVKSYVRDARYICHGRYMINAYNAYLMRNDLPPAEHSSDLLAAIWNPDVNTGKAIDKLLPYANDTVRDLVESNIAAMSKTYQKFIASYILYGDPNVLSNEKVVWRQNDRIYRLLEIEALHVYLNASSNPSFEMMFDDIIQDQEVQRCYYLASMSRAAGDGLDRVVHHTKPGDIGRDRDHVKKHMLAAQPQQGSTDSSWEL